MSAMLSGGIDVKVKHLLMVVLRETPVMAEIPFTEHSHVPDAVLSLANNRSLGHESITCEHIRMSVCVCAYIYLCVHSTDFFPKKKKTHSERKERQAR